MAFGHVGDVARGAVPAGEVIARRAETRPPSRPWRVRCPWSPAVRRLRRGRSPTEPRWRPASLVDRDRHVPPAATLTGSDTHAPLLKFGVEQHRARPRAVVDGDRLSARRGVPVHRVQMQVPAVGRGEAQLHLDLVGVVVGRGVADRAFRPLQRADVGGVRGPLSSGCPARESRSRPADWTRPARRPSRPADSPPTEFADPAALRCLLHRRGRAGQVRRGGVGARRRRHARPAGLDAAVDRSDAR